MGVNHSTPKSFGFAFDGIKTAFKKEPNLRIHLFLAIIALLLGIFLKLSPIEWLILCSTIFYVLTLELVNTVIESLVDLVSPQIQPKAKIAKDISAAIVLIGSLLAIIVGAVLFLPKLVWLFFFR